MTKLTDVLDVVDPEPWFAGLEERFGIQPAAFDGYVLHRPNNKTLWIVAADHEPPPRPPNAGVGLGFLHTAMAVPKLTTQAAMAFGHHATRNVVTLDEAGADRYLRRDDVTLEAGELVDGDGDGYVLLRCRGLTLGVGFLRVGESGTGRIRSLFPKAWSIADSSAFETRTWK